MVGLVIGGLRGERYALCATCHPASATKCGTDRPKDAREVVARGVTDTAAQKRSWLAAREFAKRSPRNIIRPYLRIPETPPFSLSGGILVLANDTRSSPRPCEKFRTKHN